MNKSTKIAFVLLSAVTTLLAGCLARPEPTEGLTATPASVSLSTPTPTATSVATATPVPRPTATAASAPEASVDTAIELAPVSALPPQLRQLPLGVQEAYRFALANPDVLDVIPCYCGCGSMGHTSNYACYIAGENSDGSIIFDNHALGCSICVDITVDAMRMLDDGQSIGEIRAYVDQTYSAFGPSNMP